MYILGIAIQDGVPSHLIKKNIGSFMLEYGVESLFAYVGASMCGTYHACAPPFEYVRYLLCNLFPTLT